jgi:hypothetical protein
VSKERVGDGVARIVAVGDDKGRTGNSCIEQIAETMTKAVGGVEIDEAWSTRRLRAQTRPAPGVVV